jgi:hypothetical protein
MSPPRGLEVFRDERIHYRIFHLAEGSMPVVVPSLDDAKTVTSDSLQAWQDLDVARWIRLTTPNDPFDS